jgi:hypothetical protein
MVTLAEFQEAAVDRIVQRLSDKTGSKRFLLADEVGLGKTMIAKGVIDKHVQLQKRRPGNPYTVVYICSNAEIAEQNRDKLMGEAEGGATSFNERLSLLPIRSGEIEKAKKKQRLQIFSITPGTSLQFGRATGLKIERRMLCYLMVTLFRIPLSPSFREFFRCGVNRESWKGDTQLSALKSKFSLSIHTDYRQKLRHVLRGHQVCLWDPDTKKVSTQHTPLIKAVREWTRKFPNRHGRVLALEEKKNRAILIGELRYHLAKVSLDFLNPNLVILDEFQKFKDVLTNADNKSTVESQLFKKKNVKVLILSATPYRMYTRAHEAGSHHEDFLETYRFLIAEAEKGPRTEALKDRLHSFREQLNKCKFLKGHDPDLLRQKMEIEQDLRCIMSRTERCRYIQAAHGGIGEVPADRTKGSIAKGPEITEYIQMREFLLSGHAGTRKYGASIMDFWKSSPSIFSFMDGHYALIKRLRDKHAQIPPSLLRGERDLRKSALDNLKTRMLCSKVFRGTVNDTTEYSDEDAASKKAWKYLWIKPTYTYYKDTFFETNPPHKFLVFSHWRFVPKTISYVLSNEVERMLGIINKSKDSNPLQFGDKTSFYHFDVCYPSLVLALRVNQAKLAAEAGGESSPADMMTKVEKIIRELLKESGISIGKARRTPFWKVMARIEGRSKYSETIWDAFSGVNIKARGRKRGETLPSRYVDLFGNWMDDDAELSVSRKEVRKLADIALYSPAVSVLRTLLACFHDTSASEDDRTRFLETSLPLVMNLCMNQLRNYFNRDLVQAVIRKSCTKGSYTSRVLNYCRKAHFQAMLDEYGYLLQNSLQRRQPDVFLQQLGRVMGMYSGSPRINLPSKRQAITRHKNTSAHFALAFGEDVVGYNEDGEAEKTRKSTVREAFNSPFWPFVLATTSVGQEGLDFHLYCRDVIHWNLPGNPVDLEQREGRLNRFDGLVVRQNVRQDYPPASVPGFIASPAINIWESVFDEIDTNPKGGQRYKHGLYPHWIYEPEVPINTQVLRRHLLFYSNSSDIARYDSLRYALSLYRLAFGQPQQEILLSNVSRGITKLGEEIDRDLLIQRLPTYMIDLSPCTGDYAWSAARREATHLLESEGPRNNLISKALRMARKEPGLVKALGKITDLKRVVEQMDQSRTDRVEALAALCYLCNPFDASFDFYSDVGLQDDIEIIDRVHGEILSSS